MWDFLWLGFLYIVTISWTIPVFFGKIVKLNLYKISSEETVPLVIKRLPKRSTLTSDDDISGWIFGWPYVGFIDQTSKNQIPSIHIYTTKKYYETLTTKSSGQQAETTTEGPNVKPKMINLWSRTGSYSYFYYQKRKFDVSRYVPRENQVNPVKMIKDYYLNHNNCVVCFVHGKPGSGKSMIPILLAKEFDADVCDTFNPTDPGDSFNMVYNRVLPTKENPLIIVFEEADVMIRNIHKNKINRHNKFPTQVTSKMTMNQFFDKIDRGVYPYLLLIMTSNTNPKEIDDFDSSYLREGRVNLRIEI